MTLVNGVGAANTDLPPARLFAHRGLSIEAPENSIPALETAWQAGPHGAEIDLQASADNVIFLNHDATLDRSTNGSGNVGKKSWSDLEKLRLTDKQGQATGHRIPTLAKVLSWVDRRPGFQLALDLKQTDPLDVGRLVLARNLAERVDPSAPP